MDKSVLIEYADMKEEIKDLRKRIDADKRELEKLNSTVVVDSVTCGKKGKKPIRTVKIQGKPRMAIIRKKELLKKRVSKLESLEIELLELTNQVEEYIENIPKSELRMIFRMYYIDDLTWYQVAFKMNQAFPKRRIKYTEDNCKQRHKRFLDNFENVTPCHDKM